MIDAWLSSAPGTSRALQRRGSDFDLADGDGGLRVNGLRNAAKPVQTGFVDTPGYAEAVTVVENIAYVAARRCRKARIIDVDPPVCAVGMDMSNTRVAAPRA